MTRENKLALVVGFALILFVGILISDYVAATQTRESADITPSLRDSLGGHTDAGRPDLIQYTTLINTTQLSSDHVADGSPTPSPSSNEIFMGQIEPPIHSTPETIGINDAYSGELPFTYHTVRPRESLATICRHYFGDPSLARELAMYNKIADPNKVNEGRRLRIPKKPEVLIRGEMALQSNSISPASKPMATTSRPEPALLFTMYTIKTGDILSRLSQDLLGTTRRMKELQELNRDVIKNPDRLIPGTVIKVPKN